MGPEPSLHVAELMAPTLTAFPIRQPLCIPDPVKGQEPGRLWHGPPGALCLAETILPSSSLLWRTGELHEAFLRSSPGLEDLLLSHLGRSSEKVGGERHP